MGGGKMGRGKKIPRDETATSSTRSAQTPFGGQKDGVLGLDGRRGGTGGDGGMANLQMADSQATNLQSQGATHKEPRRRKRPSSLTHHGVYLA